MDPIEQLERFKRMLDQWRQEDNAVRKAELRSAINQELAHVQRLVAQARCLKLLNVMPPPIVGGMVMQNVNPFAVIFDPPYGLNLYPMVIDMIDQAIGVWRTGGQELKPDTEPRVTEGVTEGYAFIAMPINPNDAQVEDVLDAIKEGAGRCGLMAERVDEVECNERITDRILESIQRAQYVIVDITHSRPNVYYEAGYAHGLGKIPIYVARKGTVLEFDLKDYPVIFFENMKQLKDGLEKRLRAIGEDRAT